MKMCVLAVLAYRNSFINDKANHSNDFLARRKKNEERETNRESLSKNTRVHRLWDTPRRRTFLKILDNPHRIQATEVIQKNCYQSIILVT